MFCQLSWAAIVPGKLLHTNVLCSLFISWQIMMRRLGPASGFSELNVPRATFLWWVRNHLCFWIFIYIFFLSVEDSSHLPFHQMTSRWSNRACNVSHRFVVLHLMHSMTVHKYHSKTANPTCDIIMIHYEHKNTIIAQQGDHKTPSPITQTL